MEICFKIIFYFNFIKHRCISLYSTELYDRCSENTDWGQCFCYMYLLCLTYILCPFSNRAIQNCYSSNGRDQWGDWKMDMLTKGQKQFFTTSSRCFMCTCGQAVILLMDAKNDKTTGTLGGDESAWVRKTNVNKILMFSPFILYKHFFVGQVSKLVHYGPTFQQ